MASSKSLSETSVINPSAYQHVVYIGIGSNLGSPLDNVNSACDSLKQEPNFTLLAQSPWYFSKALGPADQADYVNGAALIHTRMAAPAVLEILHRIENEHGRVRNERWGPRTLDLDLLLYDMTTIATETLSVPHPEMSRRNFVLRPLLDITPELTLPDGRALKDILHIIGEDGLKSLVS